MFTKLESELSSNNFYPINNYSFKADKSLDSLQCLLQYLSNVNKHRWQSLMPRVRYEYSRWPVCVCVRERRRESAHASACHASERDPVLQSVPSTNSSNRLPAVTIMGWLRFREICHLSPANNDRPFVGNKVKVVALSLASATRRRVLCAAMTRDVICHVQMVI